MTKELDLGFNRPSGKGSKRSTGPKPQYDWKTIREEYIYGYVVTNESTGKRSNKFPTYEDLAKKYGCAKKTLDIRAGKEKWVEQQKAYRETLEKQRQIEAFQQPELSEQEQINARILWDINKLFGVLEGLFEQYEYLELGSDGNFHFRLPNTYNDSEESDIKPIRVSDLKGIADILDKLHLLSSRITATKEVQVEGKAITDLSTSDIENLLQQRDSLMRQLQGRENKENREIEE